MRHSYQEIVLHFIETQQNSGCLSRRNKGTDGWNCHKSLLGTHIQKNNESKHIFILENSN